LCTVVQKVSRVVGMHGMNGNGAIDAWILERFREGSIRRCRFS
jgi:hypothetical protein